MTSTTNIHKLSAAAYSSSACECRDLAWMRDGRHTGRYGVATGKPLCKHCIALLPDKTKVKVVWSGGNGPHIYEVCNDQSENDGTIKVSTYELLSAGGHWVERVINE